MSEQLQRLWHKALAWKHRRLHWLPYRYCLLSPNVSGFIVGILIGSFFVWVLYVPRTPWMRFNWITATYAPDSPMINLEGEYEILRECPELRRARVIWRAQAISPEGHVMSQVPGGQAPPLTVGVHRYQRTMSLYEPDLPSVWTAQPIGWHVLFVATCPGEVPETVPSQLVTIVDRTKLSDPRGPGTGPGTR